MDKELIREKALELHRKYEGKIEIVPKVPVDTKEDLALAYTPGVAEPCKDIHKDKSKVYEYTNKGNMVAVVTDGTAVLGLGDIGPEAGMPVMEGKCVLFKVFGNVDAFPICLNTTDPDAIVETVKNISPGFGGINLEDIKAPKCFEIERRLIEELDIPVFHDDQHGTAVVVLAAVLNALKVVGKDKNIKIVISGAGAAGIAISKILQAAGFDNIIVCNSRGVIDPKDETLDEERRAYANTINPNKEFGSLKEVLNGADVFIGVSAPNLLTAEDIKTMNKDAIVLAMANPVPEIFPDEAKKGGARVIGTGRSDFPNQVNNVLVFPGLFRGALDAKASKITEKMKLAAAHAIADLVEEPREDYVLPDAVDHSISMAVAKAVAKAWHEE